jgi:RND family efflux transporter MFP subunit
VKLLVALSMLIAAGAFAAWTGYQRMDEAHDAPVRRGPTSKVVPVEIAAVQHGPIENRRTFTGTLVAHAEFVVASKISGRIERLSADLADTVTRGQLVAKLDDAEYVQAVAQVQADWAVANANQAAAQAQLGIAKRELERVERLRDRGVTSESQLDAARADQLTREAEVTVTRAQVIRAQAELEAARIRLRYTEVSAAWRGGSERRIVAERYVDEGETVAANAPLLRIVELDPVIAVFFVTERDYALLAPGQTARLRTDAFADENFPGTITRIAPVFRESTRQARVEMRLENPKLRLKPGLFVRVTVVLDSVTDATIVPEQALVRRASGNGVFTLSADRTAVAWRPVSVGIREGSRVQISGEALGTQVIVLGQQLLSDGAAVTVSSVAQHSKQ